MLPEWVDDLLLQAQTPTEAPSGEVKPGPIEVFKAPYLRWPGGGPPTLFTACQNLAFANLEPSGHRVLIDSREAAYIACDANGNHSIGEEVALPDRFGSCLAELECNGRSVYQQELELWSPDEEVSVFESSSGRRIDPHSPFRSPEMPPSSGSSPHGAVLEGK